MAAEAEGIEITDGLDWTRDGVVRDIVLLHQKLIDEGLQKGRYEALLDVAATIASDEQLARLRAIDDVGELADAVKALLAR